MNASSRSTTGLFASRPDAVRAILCVAMVLAVAAYWPGLTGPFLFDDAANLSVFRWWYNGQVDWRYAVLGRADPISARPLSMASFLATTWLAGPGPLSYKLGNLALHLACAWAAFAFLRRALSLDTRLAPYSRMLAVAAVALWLLHPLQVSTVLYAVQRMAQLATLFVLLALITYLAARGLLRDGRTRAGCAALFAAFPLLVVAGILSKQNAVIAPALCLVLELAYFRGPGRPKAVVWFFAASLGLPLLVASGLLLLRPQALLGGYADWDFTLAQRLLTQPRVLVDYLGQLLVPRAQRMSLFTDDFAVSYGWLSPPSTLVAVLTLVAVSAAAVAIRKRSPGLFAGWFFFLTAHLVESSVLPLEMYYEHRNYLPSIGIALALAGALALWPASLLSSASWRRAGAVVATLACIGLAVSTHARATTWRSKDAILANAIEYHPRSLRARQTQSLTAMNEKRYGDSEAIMRELTLDPDPRRRTLARIDLLSIACFAGQDPPAAQLDRAIAERRPSITLDEVLVVDLLVQATGQERCPRIGDAQIGLMIEALLAAAAAQPDGAEPKAQMQFLAALLHARAQRWPQAEEHAQRAWTPRATSEVGELLVQARLHNGQRAAAVEALAEVRRRTPAYDRAGQLRIAKLQAAIDGR